MKNCDEIVHDLLERRGEYMKLKKEKRKKVIIISATLCAFATVFFIGFTSWKTGSFSWEKIEKDNSINIASNNDKDKKNIGSQKLDDKREDEKSESSDEKEKYAIYTESIMLPEDIEDGAAYDMIGCLYYKGRVYTDAGSYSGEKLEKLKKLFGRKIGEAKGTLDEWTAQEEWSTELASTYSGSVYTVKGYSEDFRLFLYDTTGDEEWLVTLDNYGNIGLNTGSDLFEERLHLAGNIKKVIYQTHKDWNADWNGREDDEKNSYKELEITEDEWNRFIEKLYQSPFEAIDYQKKGDFYDKELQGHLYLQMKDGTEMEMRLIDDGYVGAQNLGWYYVKMPGEIFDRVMEACQK